MIDGEPLYEDHPLAFRSRDFGYSFDAHVRQRAYWDVFSGRCGHTYGNHAVWQMYSPARKPVNGPLFYWNEAIHRPGAMRCSTCALWSSRGPYLSRVPDQSLVANTLEGADHIVATRGDGYAFIYSAQGRKFTVQMGKISAPQGESVVVQPARRRQQRRRRIREHGRPRVRLPVGRLRQRLGAGARRRGPQLPRSGRHFTYFGGSPFAHGSYSEANRTRSLTDGCE